MSPGVARPGITNTQAQAPPRRLGWAVVGCGWVARDFVAPGIVSSANGRLVAVHDRDAAAMDRLADAIPGPAPTRHASLGALLSDPAVECVYVATPNHLHAEITRACASAGRHVLCEKPMATTAADALSMVEACRAAGVVYATAFDQRFHAAHRRLRGLVAEGALGVVTQARIHYACWLAADWAADNWRVDPLRAGGGALIDLAPHGIDLLEVLLGDTWETLTAFTQRKAHAYAVDGGAVLAGRFRGGALATLHVAYNCPEVYPRRTLELIGTRALAVAVDTMGQTPGGTLTLTDAATGRRTPVPVSPGDDRSPFAAQAEAFAGAVLSGRPFPYPPERDMRTFALLEAACR